MIKSKELRFQAGRMEVIDGKVKPNPAKGEIRIYLNLDNLLCFNWVETQHASSFTFEPLVIFPDEWTWERLNTRKGRAYMLRNKAFEEDRFFFWLQSADTSKDQEMEALIQGILKSGELGDRPQEAQPRSLQSHEQNQKMLDDISKVLHGNRCKWL